MISKTWAMKVKKKMIKKLDLLLKKCKEIKEYKNLDVILKIEEILDWNKNINISML